MKTKKISKVLIALDYDPTAAKVAELGYSLAKTMDAEVILLHVIVDGTYYSALEYVPVIGPVGFSNIEMAHIKDSDGLKNATQHFLDKTKEHLGDDKIKTIVKEGDFADSIVKTAIEIHADIIVMGSHSRRWLEEIILGSVTEKVLRHTKIPLYIIPTKKHD
ncbi:MAG: universal stress protein [Bacteroidota bacterium]